MLLVSGWLLVLLPLLQPANSCSLVPGGPSPPWISMEETMVRAPAVVSGLAGPTIRNDDTGETTQTFTIECIFKRGNFTDMADTIILKNVGLNSCDQSRLENGTRYVVALKEVDEPVYEPTNGVVFGVYYPDVAHSGAFEYSEEVGQTVADLFAMDNTVESVGDAVCPVQSVNNETSTMSTQTSSGSRVVSFVLSAWSVGIVLMLLCHVG